MNDVTLSLTMMPPAPAVNVVPAVPDVLVRLPPVASVTENGMFKGFVLIVTGCCTITIEPAVGTRFSGIGVELSSHVVVVFQSVPAIDVKMLPAVVVEI